MKNIIVTHSSSEKNLHRVKTKKHFVLNRLSPFLLLTGFLIFLFPYILITHGRNIEHAGLKLILLPFIIANIVYADFSLWNYLKGRRRVLIWVTESVISAIVIYWLI